MSLIPGPIDEAVIYGPKILAVGKKILSFAGKHKKLTATAALMADANLNNGKIIGTAFNAVGGALGNTVSSVTSGVAGGMGNMVNSALDGEGGGILKAVGIGGGVLAAAPLVINAIGAIGGLFKRKKKPQPGQIGESSGNATIMMQQQMMIQQQMMMQQATQQQQILRQPQGKRTISDTGSQNVVALKAANNAKPTAPSPQPKPSSPKAQDMTASREFTKGPTKIGQPRASATQSDYTPKPSQKPTAHSMIQKGSERRKPDRDEQPTPPVFKTNPVVH